MLTVAQLLFVPITLQLILKIENRLYYYVAIPAFISIFILQITTETKLDLLFAALYLLFTFVVALYGFSRFIRRGFAHIEEFAIDAGMMYLFIGGIWFFAYIAEIDTGFSPLITWLTGIHFHYSSFLLPVFIGFLGRLYKSATYKVICTIIFNFSDCCCARYYSCSLARGCFGASLYYWDIWFDFISFKIYFCEQTTKRLRAYLIRIIRSYDYFFYVVCC